MRFESPYQHGLAQRRLLASLDAKPDPSVKQLLFLATESAAQGLDGFERSAAALEAYGRKDVQRFVDQHRSVWQAVRAIPGLEAMLDDTPLATALYAIDKPYFETGSLHPAKLLIVFTTMYNNFEISNLALLALLRPLGVSLLFLKDGSRFNYLNAIPGIGKDFESAARRIAANNARNGFREVYLSGFSSSGYASLLMTMAVPCTAYLGFSIRSDISEGPDFNAGDYFTAEIRDQVPPSLHHDLAPMIERSGQAIAYRLFYGSLNALDKRHARHLAGIPHVVLEELDGCSHGTVVRRLLDGQLLADFRSLMFQA